MTGRQRRHSPRSAATAAATTAAATARVATVTVALVVLTWTNTAWGAAPVEESDGTAAVAPTPVPPAAPPPAVEGTTRGSPSDEPSSELARLFHQMQLLSNEVQALRGTVEEQQHRLDRLAREQRERYLGLDRQIAALRSGAPTTAMPAARPAPRDPQPVDTLPRSGGTEADAYRHAYAMMEGGEFDGAAGALERLIEDFPNGQYTPNAFYWLGQLHRKAGELEQARQMLVQVITLYPDHNKAPDALYNLGVVYNELGDPARARTYLGRVQQQHPNSTAAGLARTYAANLR